MSFSIECKKLRRTGFFPTFLVGGMMAALVPILNMAVRWEIYVGIEQSSIQILLGANWQMMAMLNILLLIAGGCLMYQTEYADNAIQKMCTLPIKESKMFYAKFALMVIMCIAVLAIEAIAIAFCTAYWFEGTSGFTLKLWSLLEILKNFGYSFLLMLPAILLILLISSACKNMWISLGIGVVCVFTATMLPTNNLLLSLFPFAMPFHTLVGVTEHTIRYFGIAALVEIAIIVIAEFVFIKVRRSFE